MHLDWRMRARPPPWSRQLCCKACWSSLLSLWEQRRKSWTHSARSSKHTVFQGPEIWHPIWGRERERDVRCFYECAGVEMCLRGAGGRGQCSVPWRLSWVRGRRASFRATRRLWRPADVTSGLADRSNDASEGQTGRNLNRTTWATRPTLVSQ